jgi:hypothetical protein
MILEVAALLWQLSSAPTQGDPQALFAQVKERLAPEIQSITQASSGLGPQITDAKTQEPFYNYFTVREFAQRERSRILGIFSPEPLRPMRLAVLSKFDAVIEHLPTSPPIPLQRPCGGPCVSKFSLAAAVSQFTSYLQGIQQLDSPIATIEVQSTPDGASAFFFIGNDDKAEREIDTNGSAANLYLGDYTFKINKNTYQPKELYLRLLDDPIKKITCTLRRTGDSATTTCQQLH